MKFRQSYEKRNEIVIHIFLKSLIHKYLIEYTQNKCFHLYKTNIYANNKINK